MSPQTLCAAKKKRRSPIEGRGDLSTVRSQKNGTSALPTKEKKRGVVSLRVFRGKEANHQSQLFANHSVRKKAYIMFEGREKRVSMAATKKSLRAKKRGEGELSRSGVQTGKQTIRKKTGKERGLRPCRGPPIRWD